jgi:hypothetical protein
MSLNFLFRFFSIHFIFHFTFFFVPSFVVVCHHHNESPTTTTTTTFLFDREAAAVQTTSMRCYILLLLLLLKNVSMGSWSSRDGIYCVKSLCTTIASIFNPVMFSSRCSILEVRQQQFNRPPTRPDHQLVLIQ